MMMEFNVVNSLNQSVDSEFILKLRNIYFAENYCLRRIPGLLQEISDLRLYELLAGHLYTMSERKKRLEKIFDEIDVKTSGAVCRIFKTLISKAGSAIYHIRSKHNDCTYDLLPALIEISIYRCSIYNFLYQCTQHTEKPSLNNGLKKCLTEEDDFFNSLLTIKNKLASMESISEAPYYSLPSLPAFKN